MIYRKQSDRVANYSKDILQYFDEHYSLENGQNHHKAVSHNHNHQSKRAHQNKTESHSESHSLRKVNENDKSQNASQRVSNQNIQGKAQINGQNQNQLSSVEQHQKSEYEKEKQEILNIQLSKHETDENKKNTNKFWQYFHHSTNQLVKHQNLTQDQQIYHPSDQELENKYFLEQISQIQNWNQNIKGKQDFEKYVSKWSCTTLVENIHTGDYFISQCCFEEVQSHKQNPSCFIFSQLWKYNFKAQRFQIQTKFLIDVMHGIDESSLLSNKILTVEQNQFCYIKNKVFQNETSFKKSLQLIHNKLLMPSNFEFLKTDKKSYSEPYSRQLLDQFSIDLPEDWLYDLDELEYSFVQNSSYQIFLEKNFNATKFLKEQFVLIRSEIKKDQKLNKKPSGFLIYSLDDTSTPVMIIRQYLL